MQSNFLGPWAGNPTFRVPSCSETHRNPIQLHAKAFQNPWQPSGTWNAWKLLESSEKVSATAPRNPPPPPEPSQIPRQSLSGQRPHAFRISAAMQCQMPISSHETALLCPVLRKSYIEGMLDTMPQSSLHLSALVPEPATNITMHLRTWLALPILGSAAFICFQLLVCCFHVDAGMDGVAGAVGAPQGADGAGGALAGCARVQWPADQPGRIAAKEISHGCGSKMRTQKWYPGKWNQGLKHAVPWWLNFDSCPHGHSQFTAFTCWTSAGNPHSFIIQEAAACQ